MLSLRRVLYFKYKTFVEIYVLNRSTVHLCRVHVHLNDIIKKKKKKTNTEKYRNLLSGGFLLIV